MDLSSFVKQVERSVYKLDAVVHNSGERLTKEFTELAQELVDTKEQQKTVSFVTKKTKHSTTLQVSERNLKLLLRYYELKVNKK